MYDHEEAGSLVEIYSQNLTIFDSITLNSTRGWTEILVIQHLSILFPRHPFTFLEFQEGTLVASIKQFENDPQNSISYSSN